MLCVDSLLIQENKKWEIQKDIHRLIGFYSLFLSKELSVLAKSIHLEQ